ISPSGITRPPRARASTAPLWRRCRCSGTSRRSKSTAGGRKGIRPLSRHETSGGASMKTMRRGFAAMAAAAILAAGLTVEAGPALAQGKVLKFVQNGNLTILDPIWTTAYVTGHHGYLIYDTLFASDANNAVKPQMV